MARRRAIMAHIARLVKKIISSVTGLVSFVTNVEEPTKVICTFSPVQSGTGDPSPDNVRPISGWTGANITGTRKNILGPILRNTAINNRGIESASNSSLSTGFIPVVPGNQYTMTIYKACTNSKNRFYDANKTFLNATNVFKLNVVGVTTATIPANAAFVRFTFDINENFPMNAEDFAQFEQGSSGTPYEAYQAQTLPINWESEAGTIYGGTVTLNEDGSADLVRTHVYKTINTVRYGSIKNNYIRAFVQYTDNYGNGTTYLACDRLKPFTNGTHSTGEYAIRYDKDNASVCFYIVLTQNASEEGVETNSQAVDYVNNWLENNPVNICYNIRQAYQVTYHFDNIGQLNSFLGVNNIWHDMNGDITVEYWNKQ